LFIVHMKSTYVMCRKEFRWSFLWKFNKVFLVFFSFLQKIFSF
jgi:hypothetical protein